MMECKVWIASTCWISVKTATAGRVGGVTRSCPYLLKFVFFGFIEMKGKRELAFNKIIFKFSCFILLISHVFLLIVQTKDKCCRVDCE